MTYNPPNNNYYGNQANYGNEVKKIGELYLIEKVGDNGIIYKIPAIKAVGQITPQQNSASSVSLTFNNIVVPANSQQNITTWNVSGGPFFSIDSNGVITYNGSGGRYEQQTCINHHSNIPNAICTQLNGYSPACLVVDRQTRCTPKLVNNLKQGDKIVYSIINNKNTNINVSGIFNITSL